MAPSLVDWAFIASPWVLVVTKSTLGGRFSLPKLHDATLQADLSRVFRNGVFLFGVVYLGLWGALDYLSAGPNPLFWNAALAIFTGHWFSWLNILGLIIWNGRRSLTRGLFTAGYYYALHESFWVVMMVLHRLYEAVAVIEFYQYLALLLTGVLVLYFKAFRVLPWKRELATAGLLLAYDAFWYAIGFPVSYDGLVPGFATQWVANPWVQAIEIGSWTLPSAPLYGRQDPEASTPAIFAKGN